MNTNIRDYPIHYWIIALSLDIVFTVIPVLVSFYSFYREREKFFHDANFRNLAVEKYEKMKKELKEKNNNMKNKENNKPNINNNANIISANNNKLIIVKSEINNCERNSNKKEYNYNNNLNSENSENIYNTACLTQEKNPVIIDSSKNINTFTNHFSCSDKNLNNKNNNISENYQKGIDYENLNKDFGEDLKNVDKIEKELLKRYKRQIRCAFIITILTLIIDTFCNIDTYVNLKPRFLDTQFILYNNSFLINEEYIYFNKNIFLERFMRKNPKIENEINTHLRKNNNSNFSMNKDSNITFNNYLKKTNKRSINEININNPNITFNLYNASNVSSLNGTLDISILNKQNSKNILSEKEIDYDKFIYSNVQQYLNISLKPYFNISNCKHNSREDLDKIDFIYNYSALRYSMLIINCVLDVFIMLMTTIGFIYKVQINQLYNSKFILIMILLLNKTWSMSAVSYSYFDFTINQCLNSIGHFEVFFYAYLTYVFLFFLLIFLLFVYSFLCRQLLYYILIILISGLTLFIPAIFCLDKMQRCLGEIYLDQEYRIKDDLEYMKNLKFIRDKQNFQLWFAYFVFLIIILTGLSAFVNWGILKYIWIENSFRTLAPAVGSIFTLFLSFLQKCFAK